MSGGPRQCHELIAPAQEERVIADNDGVYPLLRDRILLDILASRYESWAVSSRAIPHVSAGREGEIACYFIRSRSF
jgi:hypothetical protein